VSWVQLLDRTQLLGSSEAVDEVSLQAQSSATCMYISGDDDDDDGSSDVEDRRPITMVREDPCILLSLSSHERYRDIETQR